MKFCKAVLVPIFFTASIHFNVVAQPADSNDSFSLEQIMSAAKPSDGVASRDHKSFAWIVNREGVRNLWLVEAPDYDARRITQHKNDVGKNMGQPAFGSQGNQVFYVWGGPANRSGEYPNPTHNAGGGNQQIHMVDITTGKDVALTHGSSPTPAPRGHRLVFIRGGQVWEINTANDDPQAKPMFKIRGSAGSLSWSPDASKLAFVSYRGDHSYIGIYDLDAETIRYLSPSVDQDRHPVWSPEGDRLAYIRIPHEKQVVPYFTPRQKGLPWSIRVHNFTNDTDRQVWKAEPGQGSVFHSVYAEKQLMWAEGDHLVFPWERSGWAHLYALSIDDGQVRDLTPGSHEAHFPTLTTDKESVAYASNLDDIDRRHIWRSDIITGKSKQLTSGHGLEWGPVMMEDGHLIFAASSGTQPAHTELLDSQGNRRMLNPSAIPDDFPSGEIEAPGQVKFSATDGKEIHGQLFRPFDYQPDKKYPAVLFFHGGSRRQMLLGFHYSGYYHNCYSFNQYLANQGYMVLSVNFRSGIGYGLDFREADGFGASGASEFHDVMGAGLYMRNRDDVDGSNIGLWGGSYGGYLTALGLARASDLFKAGVDLHGVHNWNVVIEHFNSSYDPLEYREAAETAFRASPMAYIDNWVSPVMVVHGDDDRNVPFSETVDLVESLRKSDVPVKQLIFPDEVHGFILHEHWMETFHQATSFFNQHLK